jgi:hypothetical protein
MLAAPSTLSRRSALFAAALLLACTGDDSGDTDASSSGATSSTTAAATTATTSAAETTTDAATTDATTTTDTGVDVPSYAEVNAIFGAAGCTSGYCHGSGAGQLMLTGDPALDHATLVDAKAAQAACGEQTLVLPGDPDASILWLRVRPIALDGEPACLSKMPQGSDGLAEADAELIRQWILGGAPL